MPPLWQLDFRSQASYGHDLHRSTYKHSSSNFSRFTHTVETNKLTDGRYRLPHLPGYNAIGNQACIILHFHDGMTLRPMPLKSKQTLRPTGGACLRTSDQNFSVLCDIHYFNIHLLVYLTAIISVFVFVCEYVGLKNRHTDRISQAAALPPPSPLPLYGTKCLNPENNSVGRSVCTPIFIRALLFCKNVYVTYDRQIGLQHFFSFFCICFTPVFGLFTCGLLRLRQLGLQGRCRLLVAAEVLLDFVGFRWTLVVSRRAC